MFYVAVWKLYYKLMHNDLPLYFSAMKSTLPTVCRRYEIRAPMNQLPMIRHTFAKHSFRYCLINLLNRDTRSTSIMERVDTMCQNKLFSLSLSLSLSVAKHVTIGFLEN